MTLSALRLQRCQRALRGAEVLFEKSTSALRRNFNAILSECRSCLCFFQRHGLALVITNFVSLISVQARKLTHAVTPPLPKKSNDFSGSPTVLAKSYPIQTVIQW